MTRKATATAAERSRTSAEISVEIEALAADKLDVEAELGRLRDARPALLLDRARDADAKLEAHDAAIAKAGRTIERATAALDVLRPELVAARAAERQAQRREAYAKGEAAAAEYRRLVVDVYAPAARIIADALAAMQDQARLCAEANAALPDGVKAIDPNACRQPPYDPGKRPEPVFCDETYWVDKDGVPCRPALHQDPRTGEMKADINGARKLTRRVEVKSLHPWVPAPRVEVVALPITVQLPAALPGDAPFWPVPIRTA